MSCSRYVCIYVHMRELWSAASSTIDPVPVLAFIYIDYPLPPAAPPATSNPWRQGRYLRTVSKLRCFLSTATQ